MPQIEFRILDSTSTKRKSLLVFLSSAIVGVTLGLITAGAIPLNTLVIVASTVVIALATALVAYSIIDPRRIHTVTPIHVALDCRTGQLLHATNRDAFVEAACSKLRDRYTSNQTPWTLTKRDDSGLEVGRLVVDIAWFALLDLLGTTYRSRWAPERNFESEGDRKSGYHLKNRKPKLLHYHDLEKSLRENNRLAKDYGSGMLDLKDGWQIALPPATKVRYANSNNQEACPSLFLGNRFCSLELLFTLTTSNPKTGVGKLRRFTDVKGTNEKPKAEAFLHEYFEHVDLELEFNATFNWFLMLFPWSNDYLRWIEVFDDTVNDYFSYDKEEESLTRESPPFKIQVE